MKNTRRSFLTGLSLLTLATAADARSVILVKNGGSAVVPPLGFTVGDRTPLNTKLFQLPSGSSITGTNAGHFAVGTDGVVSLAAAPTGSPYTLTVAPSGATLLVTTVANRYDWNTLAQLQAAVGNAANADPTIDWQFFLPPVTIPTDSVTLTTRFNGAVTDDLDGVSTKAGFLAVANARTSRGRVSGGSMRITGLAGKSRCDGLLGFSGAGPFVVDNIRWGRTPATAAYDGRTKYLATTQAVLRATLFTTAVTGTGVVSGGAVTDLSFSNFGAGMRVGAVVNFTGTGGGGTGFRATATVQSDGTLNGATPTITGGSGYTSAPTLVPSYPVSTVAFDNPGAGYPPNRRTLLAKPGIVDTSFGYVTSLADGTLDASNFVYTANASTTFPAGTAFDVVSQTDVTPSSSFYQISVLANGTLKSNGIIRDNAFGSADPDLQKLPAPLNIRNAGRLIVEDNTFTGFYKGCQVWSYNEVDIRRNRFSKYVNDGINLYPSSAPLSDQVTGLPRVFGNDFFLLIEDVAWSNSHSDPIQVGTQTDLMNHLLIWAYNYVFTPSDDSKLTGQGMQLGDTPKLIRAIAWGNFHAQCTTNAMIIWRCDPADPSDVGYNTCIRTNKVVPGSGTAGIPATIRPGASSGYRIHHNQLGGVWDQTTGGQLFKADPGGDGSRQLATPSIAGQGTYYSDSNFFTDELVQNTGTGRSFPEVYSGGPNAFTWGGTNIGWQWWDNPLFPIRTDTSANMRADLNRIFTPVPGGLAAGTGHLAG